MTTDIFPSSDVPASDAGTSRRRRWLLIGLAIAAVLAALYALLLVITSGDIKRGTTVLGVDIGGMSRAEATSTLSGELADEAAAPVQVSVAGRVVPLDPATAGLSLDAAATAESAADRSYNPLTLVASLLGSSEVDPVVAVDDAKLDAAVTALAGQVDQAPRDGDVTFERAAVVTVEPLVGRSLLVDEARDVLASSYLRSPEVELAVDEVDPAVGADEVARVVRDFAQPAVSGPVTLALGTSSTAVVPPAALVAHVDLVAEGARLNPVVDAPGLRAALAKQLAPVETKPVDAKFVLASGGGVPQIVPSKDGTTVAEAGLAAAVLKALPSTTDRVAEVPVTVVAPRLTTAKAQSLGVKELVSTFTTKHPCCAPRVQNIHKAADILDGYVLLPGETFSLNGVLGERTSARGFVEAPVIEGGRLTKGVGGGVSQIATTTFNAMFFAGLKDVEHKPHSFYISRYPVGREATVAYPSVDLKFTNDSGTAIVFDTSYTSTSITVSFWGTKKYDIEALTGPRTNAKPPGTIYDADGDCVPQSPVAGFTVVVTRVFNQNGAEVKRESFKTRYIPEDRVYCRAKPAAPPPPAPTATPTPSPSG